jgi:hypothetical protein
MHQITPHTEPLPNSKTAAYGFGAYRSTASKSMYVKSSKPGYTYFGARYGACPDEGGNSELSLWLSTSDFIALL